MWTNIYKAKMQMSDLKPFALNWCVALGIIRFAHEPLGWWHQLISNLRHPVAGFFFPSTSHKRNRLGFCKEKTHEKISWVFIIWRRVRDSNPRTCYSQQFSRLPQSTTLPALRGKSKGCIFFIQNLFYYKVIFAN